MTHIAAFLRRKNGEQAMSLDDTILGLTEQECRAALLILAGDAAGRVPAEQAVGRVLAKTRPQEGEQ